MNYDKRIVDYCKTHNIDLGIQNVFTPITEIEQTTGFSFINEIITGVKNICILFNVEFFEYFIKQDYIKNNNVKIYFGYDCEFDKAVVLDYKYSNIELIDLTVFSQTKDIKELNKAMGNRKFDVVFSNPPYGTKGNYLDLNILNSIFNIATKIVFIHPARFILDNKFRTKICNEVRNTNYLEQVIMFWGNKMFDIGLFCPLCISIWNMNKIDNKCKVTDNALTYSKYEYEINKISIHGNKADAYKFFECIKNYINIHNGNLHINLTPHGQLSDYSVKFSLIRGNTGAGIDNFKDDFFTMICLNKQINKCDHTFEFSENSREHGEPQLHWSFNNENERENFINYCKTKIARFCLSFYKNTAALDNGRELEIVPWLDFTRSWTDKDLCKEFNISQELWDYIDKFIPDYYDDYKSGF